MPWAHTRIARAVERADRTLSQVRFFLTNTAWPEVNITLVQLRKVLDTISTQMTDTAWPEVNKTIVRLRREVLDMADVFLVTSKFAAMVLVLLAALGAAYVTHKLISARADVPRPRIYRIVEDTFLQMLYFWCLTMALGSFLVLVRDLFNMTGSRSIHMALGSFLRDLFNVTLVSFKSAFTTSLTALPPAAALLALPPAP